MRRSWTAVFFLVLSLSIPALTQAGGNYALCNYWLVHIDLRREKNWIEVPAGFTPYLATDRLIIGKKFDSSDEKVDLAEHFKTSDHVSLRILDRKSGTYIGSTEVILQKNERWAKVPIYLNGIDHDLTFRGRGLGTEAKYALLRFLFDQTDISQVIADVDTPNAASLALHLKLGFKIVRQNAKYYDLALTRSDFDRVYQNFGVHMQPFVPTNQLEWVESHARTSKYFLYLVDLKRDLLETFSKTSVAGYFKLPPLAKNIDRAITGYQSDPSVDPLVLAQMYFYREVFGIDSDLHRLMDWNLGMEKVLAELGRLSEQHPFSPTRKLFQKMRQDLLDQNKGLLVPVKDRQPREK